MVWTPVPLPSDIVTHVHITSLQKQKYLNKTDQIKTNKKSKTISQEQKPKQRTKNQNENQTPKQRTKN